MLINVGSEIDGLNEDAVNKTCARFGVNVVDMINHIDSTITPESIALGKKWYAEANQYAYAIAAEWNVPIDRVVAVISALSPRMGWVRNKEMAEHVIREWQSGKLPNEIKGALGANIRMACAILIGQPIAVTLTGIKRRSFYNNILSAGTSADVTIDTWMQRVVMAVSPDKGMDLDTSANFIRARNDSGYVAIAHACRSVAKWRNVSPSTVQAAYWLTASGSVHGSHWKGYSKESHTY